jgi:hypothetical protein
MKEVYEIACLCVRLGVSLYIYKNEIDFYEIL